MGIDQKRLIHLAGFNAVIDIERKARKPRKQHNKHSKQDKLPGKRIINRRADTRVYIKPRQNADNA